FRVGTNDAEFLAKQYAPVFDIDDLQFLPNANTAVRMMIGGVPVQPFSMATLPPLGNPNAQLADALKQLSAAKYGRAKSQVESDIFKRLATQAPPRPAMPSAFGGGTGALPPMPGSAPWPSTAAAAVPPALAGAKPIASPTPGSSFLDEWLAKKKSTGTAIPSPAPIEASSPTPVAAAVNPVISSSANPVAAQPPMAQASAGEMKIDRGGVAQDDHTVRIDKEGNLSFDGQ
ncbi:MAG TPA: hypothetical protein VG964_03145, partial [Candidatus Saccharimonadales bacterium]|nr:hypothetical protein [Candidatus Saccharimonadales bacterium]